jgi:hypothetical protein
MSQRIVLTDDQAKLLDTVIEDVQKRFPQPETRPFPALIAISREENITAVYMIVLEMLTTTLAKLDEETRMKLAANCFATITLAVARAQKPYNLVVVIRRAIEKWITELHLPELNDCKGEDPFDEPSPEVM